MAKSIHFNSIAVISGFTYLTYKSVPMTNSNLPLLAIGRADLWVMESRKAKNGGANVAISCLRQE